MAKIFVLKKIGFCIKVFKTVPYKDLWLKLLSNSCEGLHFPSWNFIEKLYWTPSKNQRFFQLPAKHYFSKNRTIENLKLKESLTCLVSLELFILSYIELPSSIKPCLFLIWMDEMSVKNAFVHKSFYPYFYGQCGEI